MMSASLQQHYSADFGNGNLVTQNQMSHSGLDTLAESSQYAMQQMQRQQSNGTKPGQKHRHSYSNGSIEGPEEAEDDQNGANGSGKGGKTTNGQPVRRRISRACDQCNQLRTKCDGQHPCAHCVEFGLSCEYARERKKRGKASRKDIAAAQAAAAAQAEAKDHSPNSGNGDSTDAGAVEPKMEEKSLKRKRSSAEFQAPSLPPPRTNSMTSQHANGHLAMNRPILEPTGGSVTGNGLHDSHNMDRIQQRPMSLDQHTPGPSLPAPGAPVAPMHARSMSVGMGDYGSIDDYHRSVLHPGAGASVTGHNILHSGPTPMPQSMIQGGTITGYGDSPYGVPSPNSQNGLGAHGYPGMNGSPLSASFFRQSPVAGSPGWLSLPSPSAALYPHLQNAPSNQTLRYPVLRPLLPHISAIIPIGLACDLLELYFSSTSQAFMQPQSPYVLGYIFRKRSFLRQSNPRTCSPALLASMLWIAAQTSESAFLTSAPPARGKICQKLLELTVGLLKPLIHNPLDGQQLYGGSTVINGVALGGFGVAMHAHDMESGNPGASGALDDVATYIHLAIVVSASEYKAASLRWWNAAWSLARELKLGRELPPNPEHSAPDGPEAEAEATGEANGNHTNGIGHGSQAGLISEEEREERRRIWWLLYIVDRHLALCYNRPLFLLDAECEALLQPENEAVWQAGEYYPGENHAESTFFRRRGPGFECTGHSLFGYFLPLMTMLGEIVDLNQARNHPRFGLRFKSSSDWDDQAAEISKQLEAYGRSLKEFETRNLQKPDPKQGTDNTGSGEGTGLDGTSPHSVGTTNSGQQRITETVLQTRIVVAYGTHLMHTLHILLNGKWDPISLLDDNDLWISSQSFISATGHAVSAAEAINDILDYDPDISFMPFYFGIYLLQGSFLLLLIADKLGAEASPSVVKACESIVRAHEACVVTLNTEYQRNFRKVMRSALMQVRGRAVEDFGEQQLRRREVLALYRWTGDGTGLAL
ncbi:Xylanolytic transcriptional activator xlnR [Pseudocercospora fuligena]|uniref:Xylanolytic transcriptional activator xlnR n=1 Tax=Pseudocercospora fuligena TaxID=685502 RepID=A0A8H6VCS1_9PEZI|nr:Xylanolytic transcriptional activator xlnR [Pseudocercospora fuligena]